MAAPYRYNDQSGLYVLRISDDTVIPLGQPTADSRAVATYQINGGIIDPFISPVLTPAEQAAQVISAGIQIASVLLPGVNGTYAIDNSAATIIDGIYSGIKGGDGLPGNGATFNFADINGTYHSFDAPTFSDFAKKVRDYRYSISQGVFPALPISII